MSFYRSVCQYRSSLLLSLSILAARRKMSRRCSFLTTCLTNGTYQEQYWDPINQSALDSDLSILPEHMCATRVLQNGCM